ncbi:MAG TPA: hypothetical protein VMX58_09095 [Patescibacteria group bacterium]|nr:hypothetical protein [Patescibacteria group bacterium]
MKQSLLLLLLLTVLSTPAVSFPGYVGLYADAEHENFAYCPAAGIFYPIEMWIWFMPGANGQMCAEFGVVYPANLIQTTVTYNNDLISVFLGDFTAGFSACYNTCQYNWHWVAHQTLYVTSPDAGHVAIGPHGDTGVYQVATCSPGYPLDDIWEIAQLYYNDPCPPGP